MMNERSMEEHITKEMVKKMIDEINGYTEKTKRDLKNIVDIGRSPQEVIQAVLLYFSML